jgi:hypothetical protein
MKENIPVWHSGKYFSIAAPQIQFDEFWWLKKDKKGYDFL